MSLGGGREVKDTASATPGRGSKVWYTGKEEEATLGINYYGARWYSPTTGQFASLDPNQLSMKNVRMFSRYAYANNNPIMYVDPDGRQAVALLGTWARPIQAGRGVGVLEGVGIRVCLSSTFCALAVGVAAGVAPTPMADGTVRTEAAETESDDAVAGVTDKLPNETDRRGRSVKGHFVSEDGDPQKDLDSLPGEMGENGQKIMPDGSRAGVHTSSTTGQQTLHINRPNGKQDVKIRYPNAKVEEAGNGPSN
ncbi:MAG TPA: RHS repeat-associated core domain-containing protein [Moraxellaceae bacterium]|nr:RHS repeat-associated core domain-containing protein [Moraxellaceae bacterium]